MNTTSIITLNVNGLNDRSKQMKLKQWIDNFKPSILVLLDHRINHHVEGTAKSLGASTFFHTPCPSKAGGILILFYSKDLEISHCSKSICASALAVTLTINSTPLSLFCFYAPSNRRRRFDCLTESIPSLLSDASLHENLLLCGDFNFVENPIFDRSSTRPCSYDAPDTRAFRNVFSTPPLTDLFRQKCPASLQFTYYSHSSNSSSRIDRAYSSSTLLHLIHSFEHIPLISAISDHSFGTRVEIRNKHLRALPNDLWRFNTSNLRKPAVASAMKMICHQFLSQENRPIDWWDSFKNKITNFCKRHSRLEASRKRGHMNSLLKRIAIASSAMMEHPNDFHLSSEHSKLQEEVNSYLSDRITFIKQCAAAKSANASAAMKILSQHIKGKKAATKITSLSHNGSSYSETKDILKIASNFYEDLYSHQSDGHPHHPIWRTPSSTLPDEFDSLLSAPITLDSLTKALFSLPDHKTLGIDGLPKELYKEYWDAIGPLFLIMTQEFIQGYTPPSLLKAATVLIFKKGDPQLIENYRPISLLGTDYKIIAKALSSRLSLALAPIINKDQTGFVRNRCIHDTITEILDTADHCRYAHQSGYLFLLDLRKAYDTLDRAFLFRSLLHLGLPTPFIEMIQNLHTNSAMHLYINGSLGSSIPLASGVRQGCPIAPQLFICAIELFHRFASSKLPEIALPLPNASRKLLSCYADDITIYFNKLSSLPMISACLEEFADVSNERPNLNKCAIIPLGPACDLPPPVSLDIPFVHNSSSERILGVHLSPEDSTDATWSKTLPALEDKISNWIKLHAVSTSRAVIMNRFLVAKFMYAAQFHPPPPKLWKPIKTVLYNFTSGNALESSRNTFRLWSKDLLHLRVKMGGLGVINPDLLLTVFSIKRILALFRPHNHWAAYSRSILPLPFNTLTFTAHKSILLSKDISLSTRWRWDLNNYFASDPSITRPPLFPPVLLKEYLAYNRFIMRTNSKPFGTTKDAHFLLMEALRIADIVTPTSNITWRFLSPSELYVKFPRSKASILCSLIECIPLSWHRCLERFSYDEAFCTEYPHVLLELNNEFFFFEVLSTNEMSSLALVQPLNYNQTTTELSPCNKAPFSLPIECLRPIITIKSKYFCPITDPSAIVFRLPYLKDGAPPRQKHLLSLLAPPPFTPRYFALWESLTHSPIDWPLAIQQRNAYFIPPRARETLFKIHAFNLPLASRLHSKHIPLACFSCKRPRLVPLPPSPSCTSPIASSPQDSDPDTLDAASSESLTHFLFDCPSTAPILQSLSRTLNTHFSTQIQRPAALLFPIPSLPQDGFPFTLLLAVSLHTAWLERCEVRFGRAKPSSIKTLRKSLYLFLEACSTYFSPNNKYRTKKKQKILKRHSLYAIAHKILIIPPHGKVELHPSFSHTWLYDTPYNPP